MICDEDAIIVGMAEVGVVLCVGAGGGSAVLGIPAASRITMNADLILSRCPNAILTVADAAVMLSSSSWGAIAAAVW